MCCQKSGNARGKKANCPTPPITFKLSERVACRLAGLAKQWPKSRADDVIRASSGDWQRKPCLWLFVTT
jgi:hypothetical protein